MQHLSYKNILVVGSGRLASGIVTNLLQSEATVYFVSDNAQRDKQYIDDNVADWKRYKNIAVNTGRLKYISSLAEAVSADVAICITEEDLVAKQLLIRRLEEYLTPKTIIAANIESFLLEELQEKAKYPGRIIGLNWCDPAHTTYFLELVANDKTPHLIVEDIVAVARNCWSKDPYIAHCGYSVRARLMAAFAREAFYLVENGYATIEDVDRACRNDAGYYLSFAGNCRYMDLMGTYAYGLVMKDLNRELSKADQPPAFFAQLTQAGKTGIANRAGFYHYAEGAKEQWEEQCRKFSFEIKDIIEKYPFNYISEESEMINSKIVLNE